MSGVIVLCGVCDGVSFPVCSAPGVNVQHCNAPTCFKYNVAVMLHLEPGSA